MDLIILNDGLYQLIPVTKQIMEGIVIILKFCREFVFALFYKVFRENLFSLSLYF